MSHLPWSPSQPSRKPHWKLDSSLPPPPPPYPFMRHPWIEGRDRAQFPHFVTWGQSLREFMQSKLEEMIVISCVCVLAWASRLGSEYVREAITHLGFPWRAGLIPSVQFTGGFTGSIHRSKTVSAGREGAKVGGKWYFSLMLLPILT